MNMQVSILEHGKSKIEPYLNFIVLTALMHDILEWDL